MCTFYSVVKVKIIIATVDFWYVLKF
jgi:hypothetical protein